MTEPDEFSAGGLVLGPDGRIVIVSNRGKTWSFPKGHIHDDEDARTCALREVHEETGLTDIRIDTELGSYVRPTRKGKRKCITMFLMRTDQTMLEPLDPHNPEARWVTPEEAKRLLSHPEDRDWLERQ